MYRQNFSETTQKIRQCILKSAKLMTAQRVRQKKKIRKAKYQTIKSGAAL